MKNFSAVTDRLSVSFRYRTSATGKWFRLYCLDGTTSVIELYDSNVNGLCYRNKSASDLKIQDISAGTWYTVRLDIDISRNLYTICVDGKYKKTGCTFRRSGTKIDGIRIESGSSYKGQAWYKDFVIGRYALFEDILDSEDTGSQPGEWSLTIPTDATCLVESVSGTTENCVVLTDNNTTSQITLVRDFAAQKNLFVASFRISDSAVGTWSRYLLSDGTDDAIAIYNSDLKKLCYRKQDGSYEEFLDLVPSTWYKVTLAVNVAEKRFDIYVDDVLIRKG